MMSPDNNLEITVAAKDPDGQSVKAMEEKPTRGRQSSLSLPWKAEHEKNV
jgi:hypothetical protein